MASYLFYISILGALVPLCCAANTSQSLTNLTAAEEVATNIPKIIDQLSRTSSGIIYANSSSSPTPFKFRSSNATNATSSATALLSSPSIPFHTEAGLTFNSRVTLNVSSTNVASPASVAAFITNVNPTSTAALADGVILGAALLSFSKSAAQIGPGILEAQTKTASQKALQTIKSNLEGAFKERGGADTGAPCVSGKQRLRFRRRGLVDRILNAFRCAIQSVNTLSGHLSEPNPDTTVIGDDLVDIGTWAEELEEDEQSDDDDTKTHSDNDETKTTSQQESKASRTSQVATRTSTPRTSANTSWTSSRSSASVMSSSTMLSNATFYPGLEYTYPAVVTMSASAQSAEILIIGKALSKFYANDSISATKASPTRTNWVATSMSNMSSTKQATPTMKPSCMADGSPSYQPTVSKVPQIKSDHNTDISGTVVVHLCHKPHIRRSPTDNRSHARSLCELQLRTPAQHDHQSDLYYRRYHQYHTSSTRKKRNSAVRV